MAGPLAAAALQPWLGTRPRVGRPEKVLVLSGYAAALLGLALAVPHTAAQPREEPSWLDSQLGAMPEGTVVLSDSGFGGYLMWRFPRLDVPLTGYGDIYTDSELERNADIEALRGGWVEEVKGTHARYAVLKPGSSLAYNLRDVGHWSVVRSGDDLELLKAPADWDQP
jgi:hypothetical protein